MRCVTKETILLLFINASLHAHCRTVLKTQNISETDSLFSLKGYTWPACICKNGNCVNEGGKQICKCNPGYGNFKGIFCIACKCGPDTNCMWPSRRSHKKICLCKPGYSQKKSKCVACECGPDSSCTFSGSFSHKKCICKPGYLDVDGKCVENPCNSSPCQNGGKCTASRKGFTCTCEEPYSGKTCETRPCDKQPCQNGGTCKVDKTGFICKCLAPFSGPSCENGPCTSNPCQNNGKCEVSKDSYRCSCNKLFTGTNCEIVMESTTLEGTAATMTTVLPSTTQYCNCGEYSNFCRKNGKGVKICDCFPGYVENHGTCDDKGTSSDGTTDSMTSPIGYTSTIGPSTVQDCNCGEYSNFCRKNWKGVKICDCFPGYVENHGICEDVPKDLLANDVRSSN